VMLISASDDLVCPLMVVNATINLSANVFQVSDSLRLN